MSKQEQYKEGTFEEYLTNARKHFSIVISTYQPKEHLVLRTECDSFLIAYDHLVKQFKEVQEEREQLLKDKGNLLATLGGLNRILRRIHNKIGLTDIQSNRLDCSINLFKSMVNINESEVINKTIK